MRTLWILLLGFNLWAVSELPKLFSQMGDPMFEFAHKAERLESDPAVGKEVAAFVTSADGASAAGLSAERTGDKSAQTEYLRQLRQLQKSYDRLMVDFRREMYASIKSADADRLVALAAAEPAVALNDARLREAIGTFYGANRLQGRSPFLDRVAKKERVETVYAETAPTEYAQRSFKPVAGYKPVERAEKKPEVIVLSTPSCPYCIKAKKFLREQKIPFRDYNINASGTGRRLYKQHNGQGVPLILVGDAVIRGYGPEAILQAYGR